MFRATPSEELPGNPTPTPNTPRDGHPCSQSPLALIHSGGMIPVKKATKTHLSFASIRWFFVRCSFFEECSKSALGCLTYSRI